jgi:hypothetical protein
VKAWLRPWLVKGDYIESGDDERGYRKLTGSQIRLSCEEVRMRDGQDTK